ncbi:MAG: TatD family hydrolase, partial [Gemmatimonas sp.]
LLRAIPDDRLLVESDAPYLAPVPRRGKRNEPAWVAHTIDRLAAVRSVPPETLAERTAENALRFFAVTPNEANT